MSLDGYVGFAPRRTMNRVHAICSNSRVALTRSRHAWPLALERTTGEKGAGHLSDKSRE